MLKTYSFFHFSSGVFLFNTSNYYIVINNEPTVNEPSIYKNNKNIVF